MTIVQCSVFEIDRTPIGLNQGSVKPLSKNLTVSNSCRQCNQLCIWAQGSQTGEIDFKRWPTTRIMQQMEFIRNHNRHVAHQFRATTHQ